MGWKFFHYRWPVFFPLPAPIWTRAPISTAKVIDHPGQAIREIEFLVALLGLYVTVIFPEEETRPHASSPCRAYNQSNLPGSRKVFVIDLQV